MRNEILANSCRICLTKTKKLRSLYKPIDEGDEPPNKMLQLITGIKVELDEHETLPKNICKNCELSLSMAFEFRENALKTHQIILTYLTELYESGSNGENNKQSIPMYTNEDVMNFEQLDCVDVLEEEDIKNLNNTQQRYCTDNEFIEDDNIAAEDIVDDDIYNQQETSYSISDSQNNKQREERTSRDSFEPQQENQDELDDDEYENTISDYQEFEYTEQQVEIVPVEDENCKRFSQNNLTKIKTTKSNKIKISKISTRLDKTKEKANDVLVTENVKLIPRRGRKPAKNTNQNSHICDICGNVFSKRGRMMEHRQRHDKECRFCCEICDKKFLTRELLRKHMFSHSGGKPLKCEFCSRTFYYESVRKAHEAVHKGLRPYICDICGKGFSYAHALKKHKLIHAEIKLYRCEYCHKDFRLQHHMKQHELTKLHKNAVIFANSNNISFAVKSEDLEENILFIEEIPEQLASSS